jgi:molybdate transport system substrate-binding protein
VRPIKSTVLLIYPILALLVGCKQAAAGMPLPAATMPTASTAVARTLTVFAAASLTDAFSEMGHDFEASHPGVTVRFNFAGSQTLSTQITQGAVADVFASANQAEMDKLVSAGLVRQDAPKDFLSNLLVIILPKNNPARILNLQDLARPGLKLDMADETVPAGKYARQVLDNMSKDPSFGANFGAEVLANVVSNESDVKQVVAKVQLGEADAGFVYISDAVAAPGLMRIAIPSDLNVVATYPIAMLIRAPQPELGSEFIAYVLSAEGQGILKKWGFTPLASGG